MNSPISEFIDAYKNYSEIRTEWEKEISKPGFYDPHDYAKEHYKEDIALAHNKFLLAFKELMKMANDI